MIIDANGNFFSNYLRTFNYNDTRKKVMWFSFENIPKMYNLKV